MKRYEQLADLLAADIRSGQRTPGSRMPSIRTLTAQHGISPSTAFQAYYRLEEKGLVRARERSGYFVTGAITGAVILPAAAPRTLATPVQVAAQVAAQVDISGLVFAVLDAAAQRDIAPLGSAFPSPTLFPLQRLTQSLGRSMRRSQPWESVQHLPQGHAGLRQQIALRYLAMGMDQPAETLVVISGALDALNLCLAAVAQPGDLVAVESPGFYASLQTLERLKMRALEIPVHPQHGLDLDALEHALKHYPVKACWFMTSFQNPTGASMSAAGKQRLVALLASHQIPLIEDDVYGELYFGNQPPLPAKAFDQHGWVMHCSSFSKTLAPGYRVGWVAPGRYGQRITQLKLMATLGASMPAQAALADYLLHGGYDKHLRRLRHILESQHASLVTAIARYFPAEVRVSQPAGGYFVWVAFAEGFNTLALHQHALSQGISIAPGPMFSARQGLRHCIRLNFGHPWDTRMENAMATLGRLAHAQATD